MRWTNEQYESYLNRCRISNSEPERDQATTLDRAAKGKEKGVGRTVVSFTGYRVRPLDPDNFAGSCKDLLDGLRHAQIIKGDEPWRIALETEQVKVGHFSQERTEIIISEY
jgi:hypothetical protein